MSEVGGTSSCGRKMLPAWGSESLLSMSLGKREACTVRGGGGKQVGCDSGKELRCLQLCAACCTWGFSRAVHGSPFLRKMGSGSTCPTPVPHSLPSFLQASQLGVYRAFVDNYGVAMETAEKCCQANAQFAEISEVLVTLFRQVHPSTSHG